MQLDAEYATTLDGDRVAITRRGAPIGIGRWTGRRIVDRPSGLKPEAPHEEAAIFAALEADLAAKGAAEVAEMQAAAYDAEGVDLSLIRWMLALSPRERLKVLDDYARSMGKLLDGSLHGEL